MRPPLPPRYNKDTVIKAADLNLLIDAIEWLSNMRVDVTSGLEYAEDKVGRTIRMTPSKITSFARVVTQIDGAEVGSGGLVLGSGQIVLQTKNDDDSLADASDPNDPLDCFNSTLAPITQGTQGIQVKLIDGDWAVDVAPCG